MTVTHVPTIEIMLLWILSNCLLFTMELYVQVEEHLYFGYKNLLSTPQFLSKMLSCVKINKNCFNIFYLHLQNTIHQQQNQKSTSCKQDNCQYDLQPPKVYLKIRMMHELRCIKSNQTFINIIYHFVQKI